MRLFHNVSTLCLFSTPVTGPLAIYVCQKCVLDERGLKTQEAKQMRKTYEMNKEMPKLNTQNRFGFLSCMYEDMLQMWFKNHIVSK